MTLKDAGGQAFPSFDRLTMLRSINLDANTKETLWVEARGMTLRDYFAAKALSLIGAMAANRLHDIKRAYKTAEEGIAADAYAIADAMLAERAK